MEKLDNMPPGSSVIQDVIFDLPIGRQRHASIVGKRGLTLQQLSASANCRIWVPPKELKLDVVSACIRWTIPRDDNLRLD